MKKHITTIALFVGVAVMLFAASAQAQYTIDSTQADAWDGFIVLYENSFDPLDPTTDFIDANDDGPGGLGTSQLTDLALEMGVEYILVTTGFLAGDDGAYETVVSGPLGPIMMSGDTTGGMTWDRPFGDGACCSTLGPVAYQEMSFQLMVPEPSALASLVIGLAFWFRRR